MKRKIIGVLFGVLLGLGLLASAPRAQANDANQAAQFTFNRPLRISGNMVLPAGTYWFLIPDNMLMPDVVRIFNADRTHIYATVETIPTTRAATSSGSELRFAEPRNQPLVLMTWYYPDRLTGHEFLYSPREESRFSESQQLTVIARPVPQADVG